MSGTWATDFATGDVVTAAEYRKSMGCVADSTLGVSAASFDFTGLPTTYAAVMVVVKGQSDNAATQDLYMRFNNDTTANYNFGYLQGLGGTASSSATNATASPLVGAIPSTGSSFGSTVIWIPGYGGSTSKGWVSVSTYYSSAALNQGVRQVGGVWTGTAAISRITLLPATGNFVTGSRVSIYVMGS